MLPNEDAASARELFVCGGVSQVAFAHPAVVTLMVTTKENSMPAAHHPPRLLMDRGDIDGVVVLVSAILNVVPDERNRQWWWDMETYVCLVRQGVTVSAQEVDGRPLGALLTRVLTQGRGAPLTKVGSPLPANFTVGVTAYNVQGSPDWNDPELHMSDGAACDRVESLEHLKRYFLGRVAEVKTLMKDSFRSHPVSVINIYDAAAAYGESPQYREASFFQL